MRCAPLKWHKNYFAVPRVSSCRQAGGKLLERLYTELCLYIRTTKILLCLDCNLCVGAIERDEAIDYYGILDCAFSECGYSTGQDAAETGAGKRAAASLSRSTCQEYIYYT